MPQQWNHLGQPIGKSLPEWQPRELPPREAMVGRYCRVEALDAARHAAQLWDANSADGEGRMWTYLPYGPFGTREEYFQWVGRICAGSDPLFYAIIDSSTGRAAGVCSYLRIDPSGGVIEVGHIALAPSLQRTAAATEAMFLMMGRVFDLGYRRYEWKCDSLNAPSRAAAERLGFAFEGVFRQATIYKGRSRDTAWYSIIDSEWPPLRDAFSRWLDPANFETGGGQRLRLSDLTRIARQAMGTATATTIER